MKRYDDRNDGNAYPEGERIDDPSLYPELQLRTYAEVPTPAPRHDSSALLALGLFDYDIVARPDQRKGPAKQKVPPEVWCPGQEFDPGSLELLELMFKFGKVGNA